MKANRLITQKSPYLLQHAFNPVDWFPWCNEAFEKAKNENKPIFLSIGYSTCHWCHVMEKESFEDSEVAEILNNYFVSIKVDREERPDIDSFYMKVCQSITGSGGWPLTVIMTPDKKPFFAGTYFPKETLQGRIGLKQLLTNVINIWETRRNEIYLATDNLIDYIINSEKSKKEYLIDENLIHSAYKSLEFSFDRNYGGFGPAPKFPIAHNLLFLIDYGYFFNDQNALEMASKTLTMMRFGGLYDQIEFGFHRYSTDAKWILPHFEKMLYDQGMLLHAYSRMYSLNNNPLFLQNATEITDFVLNEFLFDNSVFFSSLDADSEGEEGKYYLFHYDELKRLLNDDFELFTTIFSVAPDGNFFDPHNPNNNKNILYLEKSLPDIANELNVDPITLEQKYNAIRKKLLSLRNKRKKPFKDYKILIDWNGLMFVGLSNYFGISKNNELSKIFDNYYNFLNNAYKQNNKLFHCYIDGNFSIEGFLDDYAFSVYALLEIFKSTSNTKFAELGHLLLIKAIELFWDENVSAFRLAPLDSKDIIYNPVEFFDGAIPSGNSVMYNNLNEYYRLTGNPLFQEISTQLEKTFSNLVLENPSAYNFFNYVFQRKLRQKNEIVICYTNEDTIQDYRTFLGNVYRPETITIWYNVEEKFSNDIFFWKKYKMIDNKPTAYICSNFQCNKPTNNFEDFKFEIEKIFGNKK